jgi:hypothetical protein
MPNWIAITIGTLYEAKVSALIDACDSAALAEGQDNRSAGIIQGVIDEIRNAVGSCESNQVDDDETKIPKSLRDLAVDLIIARLKGSLEIALTDDESNNVAYRRRQLGDIMICKLKVEQPDTPVTPPTQSGPATQYIPTTNPFGGMGLS